jgi:N-acetylneuraminic acid mutarotase
VAAVNVGKTVIVAFGPTRGPTVGPSAQVLPLVFAAFDPQARTWSRLRTPPAALQVFFTTSLTLAWSGHQLYVVGFDQSRAQGASTGQMRVMTYDPIRNAWALLADPPIQGLIQAAPVWTGHELLLYGSDTTGPAQGASYDPSTRSWQAIPAGPLGYRTNPATVWTGHELIVWGGERDPRSPQPDGAAYSPTTRQWRTLPPSPLVGYRAGPASAWSGREFIVWSGYGAGPRPDDGAAYNPTTNQWRTLAPAPIPGREQMTSIWTGRELLVWGGISESDRPTALADGATYNPSTNTWQTLPTSPLVARRDAVAANASRGVIIVGGYGPTGYGTSSEAARTDGATVTPGN